VSEYAEFADEERMTYAPVRNLGAEIQVLQAECDKWKKAWFEELTAKAVAEVNFHSYQEWWAQEHAKVQELEGKLAVYQGVQSGTGSA
jgi:phage host-nuclease inhibitor protein Gam